MDETAMKCGAVDFERRGRRDWKRTSGPIVLTSKWRLTSSAVTLAMGEVL